MAASTLEAAKAMVAQLRLDIDFGEAFVPGIRRGYAIVPYTARSGETESHFQERLRGAMARVRQANVLTSDEGPQRPRHLWLNFPTFSDRRKRAILAGKIKRAVLESGVSLLRPQCGFEAEKWQGGNSAAPLGHADRMWMGGRDALVNMLGKAPHQMGALKGAIQ